MVKTIIIILLTIISPSLFAQITLTIEGTLVNDSTTGISSGVNIPRNQKTIFIFRNNSITSVNESGYMLQAGDENPGNTNNNLDGEIINPSAAGADVKNGVISVDTDRLYNVVDLHGKTENHILKLEFQNSGIQAYTFTFG